MSHSPSPALAELDYYSWAEAWRPVSRGDLKSLVDGATHYIRNGDGVEELYNLDRDAGELQDLGVAVEYHLLLKRLRASLDSILD